MFRDTVSLYGAQLVSLCGWPTPFSSRRIEPNL
jgi:hypothetical protein